MVDWPKSVNPLQFTLLSCKVIVPLHSGVIVLSVPVNDSCSVRSKQVVPDN